MNPQEFISKFTDKQLLPDSGIYSTNRSYFLLNQEVLNLPLRNSAKPEYIGTFLGRDTNKGFIPSFLLLEMLREHAKKIVINEKSAWLFLCGRNILKQNIIQQDNLKVLELVLVLNEREEVLGYGQVLKADIRNILDRGDFLRRERLQAQQKSASGNRQKNMTRNRERFRRRVKRDRRE
jgi:ribosome biogenesis protein Nip4